MNRRRAWQLLALTTGLVVALTTSVLWLRGVVQQQYDHTSVYQQQLTSLTVYATSADVEIDQGPAGQVTVAQQLTWTATRPTVEIDRAPGSMRIVVQCDDYGPISSFDCGVQLRIEVPPTASVTANSDSGDITARQLAGPLNLQSDSGDVELDRVSGRATVLTTSGPINGNGLLSSDVDTESSSGPVDLGFTGVPLRVLAKTTSGPIELDLPPGSHYRVSGSSTSGPRDVQNGLDDPSAAGSVRADSTSGPVDID